MKNIKSETLYKVISVFNSNEWEIDSTDHYRSLYHSFCTRLSMFSEPQQEIILDLTTDFFRLGMTEYKELFLKAFKSIRVSLLQSAKHIYILPLEIHESKKTKSSHTLWSYLNRFCDFTKEPYFDRVIYIESFDAVKRSLIDKCLYIFIDDFLGSGDTVINNTELNLEIKIGEKNIPKDKIINLALIAQEMGLNNIRESIGTYTVHGSIRKRGITDSYSEPELSSKISLMTEIEDKLKIKDDFRFGYARSESLITLGYKSPNNTFPVFWHETKRNIAPFPRYKKYEKIT